MIHYSEAAFTNQRHVGIRYIHFSVKYVFGPFKDGNIHF